MVMVRILLINDGDGEDTTDDDRSPHSGYTCVRGVGGVVGSLARPVKQIFGQNKKEIHPFEPLKHNFVFFFKMKM